MNSIIVLLTDFGAKDYYVGAMKGVILSINRSAKIINLTHEIAPQDISSASFTLCACYRDFPKQTIFVAVVDPGVGSNRKAILVETKDYFFIAPDNGLLSFIFDEATDFRVFELTNKKFFKHPISQTFHGRDIFAPIAAHLSNGVKTNEFGNETQNFVRFEKNKPRKVSDKETEAEIIYIDRFGNLITNLTQKDLPENFTLKINETKIEKIQNFFAEADDEELFMILGSAGFLEIVAFQNSAATLLKVKRGQKVRLIENVGN